jgi:anti-anti-sigma factor
MAVDWVSDRRAVDGEGGMDQSYSVRRTDDGVWVIGDIDLGSALGFTYDLLAAVSRDGGAEDLELDLTGVTFIDSSGLQALITVVRSVSRPVRIAASSRVFVALDVIGLTDGKWDGVTISRVEDERR